MDRPINGAWLYESGEVFSPVRDLQDLRKFLLLIVRKIAWFEHLLLPRIKQTKFFVFGGFCFIF